MTNIWAKSFEEVRRPFFEMEDPYTLREKKEKEKEEKGETEGKAKRWWDDDDDGIGYEKGEVSGRFKKKKVKEQVESLVEVDKKVETKEKKIDVMKGRNTINTKPTIGEEVQAWVDELIEEGYDLSKFTWDEIVDIYESSELNEGTAGMPAAGDAQTVVDDSPSKKIARAKIQKDMADLKYQKAVATMESFDSIVEYLSNRKNIFENLEEGVFDPKKSKLRPASERSKTAMTDAQRKAQKKAAARTAEIHSKGETVLAGLRSSGTRGRVQTTPTAKSTTPSANRKVKGRYDKLAKAASDVLRDIQNK